MWILKAMTNCHSLINVNHEMPFVLDVGVLNRMARKKIKFNFLNKCIFYSSMWPEGAIESIFTNGSKSDAVVRSVPLMCAAHTSWK